MKDKNIIPTPLQETFFIKRVAGILLTLLFIVGGISAYLSLTKEDMPDIKIPFATITTEWPGGDPESVEKRITNKIEEKIKATANLKRYESASYNSFSVITAEFYPDEDADECINNLRAEVDKVDDLPVDAKKPVITKASVNDVPIFTVNLFGEINTSMKNKTAQELKDQFLMIPGVRDININGQRKDEVFIMLDLNALYSLGISSESVRNAITDAHIDMPLEDMESAVFSTAIKLEGRFRDLNDLRNLTVARIGERPVALREIAEVRRDLAQKKNIIRMSYKGSEFMESLSLDILRSPGGDTLKIIEEAKKILAKFANSDKWPSGLDYQITDDTSITIRSSLNDVFENGMQAVALVALTLIIALTWREALVAALSIPITILGVIAVLPFLGYTMNKMVIIGMVLALGMLVDVFILMMEGMHDNIFSEKLDFTQSALKTVKTYALAAFTGQLTTIFAFLPLAFIPGVTGKFIRIIPVIVSLALFLSFIVAVLIDIPLSWFVFYNVNPNEAKKTYVDRFFEWMQEKFCELISQMILINKFTAFLVTAFLIGMLLLSFWTVRFLRNEMFPKSDSLTLGATIEMSPSATLEQAEKVAETMGRLFKEKKYLESVVTYAGKRSPMAKNAALLVKDAYYLVGFGCRFIPKKDRDIKESYKYIPELRKETEEILAKIAPGAKIQFFVETGGATSNAPVQLRLIGNDMTKLRLLSHKMQNIISKIQGTSDVADNLGPAKTAISLTIDRETSQFYKISADSIGKQLRHATGNDEIAQYPVEDSKEELKIRLGTLWHSRKGAPGGPMTIEEISKIILINDENKPVQLASLLKMKVEQEPLSITHYGGSRTVVVTCETNNRPALEILGDIEKEIQALKEKGEWPARITYSFGGEIEEMEETYGGIWKIVAIAVFLVFTVLAMQFGNFSQPLIIFTSVPSSLIGVLLGFFFLDISFSFPAAIGVISLTGIAVNDAIVMIETMNRLREEGKSLREASILGGSMRLRPILLTTITTVVGLIPLALSDPCWMPLCMAIILGISASTIISLFAIPCLYLLFTRDTTTA